MEDYTLLDGEVYKIGSSALQLIKVNSPQSFVRAVQISEQIETEMDIMSAEAKKLGIAPDCHLCQELLTKQAIEINKFRDSINVYNPEYLSGNLTKLAAAAGIRFSDIDDMLGVSNGYVARTIKIGSKKRLSIDMVRNLSELFNVNIDDLISRPLYDESEDMKTMIQFLDRLKCRTENRDFAWRRLSKLDPEYMVLFKSMAGRPWYRFEPQGEDISVKEAYYEEMKDGAFYIIRLLLERTYEKYEVLRANNDCFDDNNRILTTVKIPDAAFLKICDSADDPSGLLKEKIKEIINSIKTRERDYRIESVAKQFITEFMGEEDD